MSNPLFNTKSAALCIALTLAGCGGGSTSSTTSGGLGAAPAKVASHWEVPRIDFGTASARVKTYRSVLLYNDGSQAANYGLLYNFPPSLSAKGCSSVQPGGSCKVVFTWAPVLDHVFTSDIFPDTDMRAGTQLPVQGVALSDTSFAMAPFWTEGTTIQWEGTANFTLANGHNMFVTRIAWSNAGQVANSQCEAVFQGSVAPDLDGRTLQVKDARMVLEQGQVITTNGEKFTRYQRAGDATLCSLPKLNAGSGNYIINIQ